MTSFDQPANLDEAHDRKDRLVAEAQRIAGQLNSKRAKTRSDYPVWRERALAAWRAKHEEIRFLKGWIRRYHENGKS